MLELEQQQQVFGALLARRLALATLDLGDGELEELRRTYLKPVYGERGRMRFTAEVLRRSAKKQKWLEEVRKLAKRQPAKPTSEAKRLATKLKDDVRFVNKIVRLLEKGDDPFKDPKIRRLTQSVRYRIRYQAGKSLQRVVDGTASKGDAEAVSRFMALATELDRALDRLPEKAPRRPNNRSSFVAQNAREVALGKFLEQRNNNSD